MHQRTARRVRPSILVIQTKGMIVEGEVVAETAAEDGVVTMVAGRERVVRSGAEAEDVGGQAQARL